MPISAQNTKVSNITSSQNQLRTCTIYPEGFLAYLLQPAI
jgi:hypothetical protein